MKKLLALIFTLGLSAGAHAAAPTPESIEKLLKLTEAEKVMDAIRPQFGQTLKKSMEQATQGHTVSPDEQKVVDNFRDKAIAIMQTELTFEKLKPMYVDIYAKSFTQEEIDGLISFYESAAGKALVAKMPVVMQTVMGEMPRLMNPMMEKIAKAGEEMKQELAALRKKQDSK